jgi:hypothetical protein
MLKAVAYFAGPLLVVALLSLTAYLALKNECSLNEPLVNLDAHSQPNGANEDAKASGTGKEDTAPKTANTQPSARFDLSVTDSNKIEGRYYAENAEGEKGNWGHKFLCETKIGDFSLAVFTLFLVIFTGLLWFSTGRLVEGADLHSERELRAYISFTPQSLANALPNLLPEASFIITNTGQTPAYNIRYSAILEVLPHPLVKHQGDLVAVHSDPPTAGRPIHSKDHIFGGAKSLKKMTSDEYQKMIGPDHRLYLAGIVWYEDVFKEETRKTKFCVCVGGDDYGVFAAQAFAQPTPIIIPMADWAFSHVHNDAT